MLGKFLTDEKKMIWCHGYVVLQKNTDQKVDRTTVQRSISKENDNEKFASDLKETITIPLTG